MAETIDQLAKKLDRPVNELKKLLQEALGKDATIDTTLPLSTEHRQKLLNYLANKGREPSDAGRITLKRREVVSLKTEGQAGNRSVKVDYRRKKTYVQAGAAVVPPVVAPQEAPAPVEAVEPLLPVIASEPSAVATPEPIQSAAPAPVVEPITVPEVVFDPNKAITPKKKPKAPEPRSSSSSDRDSSRGPDKKGGAGKGRQSTPQVGRGGGRIDFAMGDDEESDGFGGAQRRRRRKSKNHRSQEQHGFAVPTGPIVREVHIPQTITVGDLAQRMAVKASEVIKCMMGMGVIATINQVLDQEIAAIVVEEMGHKAVLIQENALESALTDSLFTRTQGEMKTRAPVVTIMGHVDHGKTSLLDYIRRTRVTAGEAGGITQHIGAYQVHTEKGEITFLDTPGHAAFTSMRARGALCTDVVVLVVAADDGVMPQTIEAIQHAKAANVPVIVAVNKMDKPGADPEAIKTALTAYELVAEEWGGETMFVPVSAKTGMGIDALLDSILVQAEILELKAAPDGPAKGVVIESRLDKGRGVVASVLVQQGTLHPGDIVLVGLQHGRVRAMHNEIGQLQTSAGPSTPVEILGLSGLPNAGDDILVVDDERKAREVALYRQAKHRELKFAKQHKQKMEGLLTQMGKDNVRTLNVVLKADVQGSVEAICDSLTKLSNAEVRVKILGSGVGGINESDVTLALASNALLIGFNVRADASSKRIAQNEGVEIHYYSIIYDIINQVKAVLTGMLMPVFKEEMLGLAEVRDVFRSSKLGAIAGCMVVDGVIKRHQSIRVLRNNVVVFEGQLESLRRFKDDVQEVRQGMECGIGVKNYNDIKPGDQIEVFEKVQVVRTL
ncbi:MAG: translation initiation factor IF-2 [Gammaproteobacteria bacterium]